MCSTAPLRRRTGSHDSSIRLNASESAIVAVSIHSQFLHVVLMLHTYPRAGKEHDQIRAGPHATHGTSRLFPPWNAVVAKVVRNHVNPIFGS